MGENGQMSGNSIVREIQLAELEILKEVQKICSSHDLTYFAIGGTMLGAVRHKGFIPWDDDIDIGMPRTDYNRFIEYAKKELPSKYEVLLSAGTYRFMYAKIHNVDTAFVQAQCMEYKEWYYGVFVDIMPFDGVPSSKITQRIYYKLIKEFVKMYTYRKFGLLKTGTAKMRLANIIPRNLVYKLWNKIVQSNDFYKREKTCFTWTVWAEKLTFDTSLFRELIQVEFEDIYIPVPKNYDLYLTSHFGDYLTLPPKEQRVNHSCDGGIIDLNHSYKKYL